MRFLFLLISLTSLGINSFAQPVLTYVATNVPVGIPDGPFGIGRSSMEIADNFIVLDVDIIVTVMHSYVGDVRLFLEAPNGEVVRLVNQCNSSGDNFIDTHFDDEADTDICDGSPPYTGRFRPDRALSLFDNLHTNGTWEFRATDDFSGDTGTIQAWRLEITADTTVSAHDLPVVTSFSVGQNYPNPFNATTILPIELGKPSRIALTIYNNLGQSMFDGRFDLSAGTHTLPIDGSAWSSGSYFAKVSSGVESRTTRMILLK